MSWQKMVSRENKEKSTEVEKRVMALGSVTAKLISSTLKTKIIASDKLSINCKITEVLFSIHC